MADSVVVHFYEMGFEDREANRPPADIAGKVGERYVEAYGLGYNAPAAIRGSNGGSSG